MKKPPTNVAASVRARLLNIRVATGEDYNELLVRFCLERLLYRLSISPHREQFILKGALLFSLWLLEILDGGFGTFDLDPCSPTANRRRAPVRARVHFTSEDDGLSLAWRGTVFLNPPYGRELTKWVHKAREEVALGNATTPVALIPARTDTAWWHDDIVGRAMCFSSEAA